MAEAANTGVTGDELQRWLTALTWELEQARQEYASLRREVRLLKHDLRLAHAHVGSHRSVRRAKSSQRHAS